MRYKEYIQALSKDHIQDGYMGGQHRLSWRTSRALCLGSPKDTVNISILHAGSKVQDKGDSRNHGL